ncbi:alpha/beta fold hydrolase [Solimicrobium silvestre]|uniref:Alpha/beta hydrolase family n=1 Tax=Solimicrobium silvestre TaxID=2099400 RepID=A0A2S9GXR3_9BURK|nr:alpha/beta fold hydrolase [Solimicrobium silvestre]PRC92517.1 Alpha/beta hydrolase family [Solimicrobium silvestre]
MTITPTKLIFLPGAGGSAEFWHPVASLLTHPASRVLLGWPGFGSVPANSDVQNIDDLVALVVDEIDQPSALLAQSMGGVVAIQAALKRPELITHLVLAATSGGVNMSDLQVADWRQAFIEANPTFPRWFADYNDDLSTSIVAIQAPTLLLWGDSDLISPIDVGLRLKELLPSSRIHVLPNGEHDFASKLAASVAPLIDTHLNNARST